MTDSKKEKTNGKNAAFGVWMPREELRALDEKAEMSGYSRNTYIRRSAAGNVTVVDTRDLHRVIEQLRTMHCEYDSHLDRFYDLARQALEAKQEDLPALLGMILEESGHLERLRRSMQAMETGIDEILISMRDAVEGASSING